MDAVEDIKARLSIEDVIGEYIPLKRAGRNLRGLSPFSSEKTPSFMVSPEKQIWHDFSSGKGGNMFSFVMEVEGLDFRGALELLARKAGIDLAQYGNSNQGERTRLKNRMYEAYELATKFYQVQFSKSKSALTYVFTTRKFSKEIALAFQLGYSPNTGNALLKYLTSKGFSAAELQQTGLVTKSYREPSDMFRGRLMIPLADAQGRVIGFTARLLEDIAGAPKYINTPQTILYDKSRHVYGFHLAKEAIRKNGYVVITEGNLDVIASHQIGVNQVVATAGTAVTEQHLKIIHNLTSDVRFAFDQDQAGQTATERAIPIASKVGINLNIITIEGGKDPDELIRTNPEAWKKIIEQPVYAVDWLIDSYKSQIDLNSALGKRQFSDIILPVVAKLSDPIEQDHYMGRLAEILSVSKEALRSKLKTTTNDQKQDYKRPKNEIKKVPPQLIEQTRYQDQLLAIFLINANLRKPVVALNGDMLTTEDAKSVLKFLQDNIDFQGDPLGVPALNKNLDYVKILMLQYEALYQNLDETELDYESKRLQDRLLTKYVKQQKDALSIAMQNANEQEMKKLLNQAKDLDILLKQTREVLDG